MVLGTRVVVMVESCRKIGCLQNLADCSVRCPGMDIRSHWTLLPSPELWDFGAFSGSLSPPYPTTLVHRTSLSISSSLPSFFCPCTFYYVRVFSAHEPHSALPEPKICHSPDGEERKWWVPLVVWVAMCQKTGAGSCYSGPTSSEQP